MTGPTRSRRPASRPHRPPAARAAAAPGRRQPLPPRHRRRAGRRLAADRARRSPRPPRSASPGSCRSAATCPAPAGRSRRPPTHDALVAGVALHPNEAPRLAAAGPARRGAGRDRARWPRSSDRVRAVGETGLDYFRTGEEGRAAQQRVVPRGTSTWPSGSTRPWSSTTATPTTTCCGSSTRRACPERWVMHCFSGDADFARACLDRGACLSFAGTVTFKNAEPLREALRGGPAGPGAGRDRRAVPDPDAVPRPARTRRTWCR